MRFHTKHKAKKIHDEVYDCNDCGTTHMSYATLHHPSEDSGGFCQGCGSESLTVRYLSTLYVHLWLTEEEIEDVGLALEVAEDVDDWKAVDFTVSLGEKDDD